ncbi:MAG: hypothetical protein M1544_02145 [Candidatus Marsarchaeota archaeon]|nr:hypothetical protein [Candidatus Marsarchaeota archaeon]
MQKSQKAQSAIEFITTYSTVLLIITVAIAVLFLFISLPASILPTECNFYNTFGCYDAVYGINYTSSNVPTGTALLVVANLEQPGIVNTSSFSAFIAGKESNTGFCTPQVALQGQKVYCIAYFYNRTLTPGKLYSGTFSVYGNYCSVEPSKLYSGYCPPANSSNNYMFGGVVRTQGSLRAIGGIYAVPIKITLSGFNFFDWFFLRFIEPGYQVEISFNPKNTSYSLHESPDLGNIRFYYNNEELYDWCQNCNDSMTGNAIFWVRIPQGTAFGLCGFGNCNSTFIVYMYFTPISTTFSGIHSGLAPQLTSTYGEYDNGKEVFNYYTNFAGTSLPATWVDMLGSNYTVNDGLYMNGGGAALIQKSNNFPINIYNITEAQITITTSGTGGFVSGVNGTGSSTSCSNGPYDNKWISVGTGPEDLCYGDIFSFKGIGSAAVSYGVATNVSTSVPSSGTFVAGMGNGFANTYFFYNDTLQVEQSQTYGHFKGKSLGAVSYFGIESQSAVYKVQWVRSIAMLSGGEEPQISFGPIIKESG